MWEAVYILNKNINKKKRRFYNDKQMKNFAPPLTAMANGNNNAQRKKSIIKRVSWSLDEPTHDRENIQHDEMVSKAN